MVLEQVDVILRAGGAGAFLVLAALLVSFAPRERLYLHFLALALGLSGFLGVNAPVGGSELIGPLRTVASVLSGNAAILLWWFCLAVFDDDFRLSWPHLAVGAIWAGMFAVNRGYVALPGLDDAAGLVLLAMVAGLVAHLGWRLVQGREDDLVEPRRRARLRVAVVLIALLGVDLLADVLMGTAWRPPGFTILQNLAILAVVTLAARWLLRPNPVASASTASPSVSIPDNPLKPRLDDLMGGAHIYLDPDLTLATFVRAMSAPEASVRRLINQDLGYRHFKAFLNAYRVAAARRTLGDPEAGAHKIASIAFDVGFASLASFNRAFKAVEGVSPSSYRATALTSASEKRNPGK